MFGENDCIWCNESFKNKKEYDEHYLKCANNNHIKPDEEEAFELINNTKNY